MHCCLQILCSINSWLATPFLLCGIYILLTQLSTCSVGTYSRKVFKAHCDCIIIYSACTRVYFHIKPNTVCVCVYNDPRWEFPEISATSLRMTLYCRALNLYYIVYTNIIYPETFSVRCWILSYKQSAFPSYCMQLLCVDTI